MFKTQELILKRMSKSEHEAFCAADFSDLDNPKMISKSLELLEDDGYILRARRGIYYKNNVESFDPLEVALAIGRSNNWVVAPCGDYALYLVGLHDENFSNYSFVSTGPYGFYDLVDEILEFKHSTSKSLPNISTNILIVIQAIKELGKERINEKIIAVLKNFLSEKEKQEIIKGEFSITVWIQNILNTIAS